MTTKKDAPGRTTPKKEKVAPPVSLAEFRALKQPARETMRLCADRSLSEAAKEAASRLEGKEREHRVLTAMSIPDEQVARLEAELLDAQAEAEEARAAAEAVSMEFIFQAMGGHDLEQLMKDHRPTRQQQQDYQDEQKRKGMPGRDFLDYNPDSFPPELLWRTIVQPEVTRDEAVELLKDPNFSQGELTALLTLAWNVNQLLAQ